MSSWMLAVSGVWAEEEEEEEEELLLLLCDEWEDEDEDDEEDDEDDEDDELCEECEEDEEEESEEEDEEEEEEEEEDPELALLLLLLLNHRGLGVTRTEGTGGGAPVFPSELMEARPSRARQTVKPMMMARYFGFFIRSIHDPQLVSGGAEMVSWAACTIRVAPDGVAGGALILLAPRGDSGADPRD